MPSPIIKSHRKIKVGVALVWGAPKNVRFPFNVMQWLKLANSSLVHSLGLSNDKSRSGNGSLQNFAFLFNIFGMAVPNKRYYIETRNTFCGTWYLPHSQVHKSIAELCSNFGDSAITKGQIAYFSLRMRKTVLLLLSVKI